MRNSVQLVTYGFWGGVYPPPLAYNLSGKALFQGTQDSPARLQSVSVVSDGDSAFLRLAHQRQFSPLDNRTEGWTDVTGAGNMIDLGATLFSVDAFGNGYHYVEHADATPWKTSEYISGSGGGATILPANAPWSFNGYLYVPTSNVTTEGSSTHLWQLSMGRFAFQLRDGKPEAMWRSNAWTRDQETLLWLLYDANQNDQADALKSTLYDVFTSLDIGGEDYFINHLFELDFMPEPTAGRIGIEAGNGKRGVLQLTRPDTDLGKPMTLWNEGRVHVYCNGGRYFWQLGKPVFAPVGTLTTTVVTPCLTEDLGTMNWTLSRDLPNDAATAEITRQDGSDVYHLDILVNLASDGALSPVVYAAAVSFTGGERDGGLEVAWDSDNHLINGKSPVIDARPSWDDRGRSSWELDIPLLQGTVLHDLSSEGYTGYNYPYMEDRVASVFVDGVAVITHGLVTSVKITEMASMQPNLTRPFVERRESMMRITVSTSMAIAEQTKLAAVPVGDYLYAGTYARILLRGCGFSVAEVAGIDSQAGALITGALPGQDWAESPAAYSDVASVLRGIEEKYGMGRKFVVGDDGVWTFDPLPTSSVATFTSNGANQNPHTADGQRIVLQPFDWERGGSDDGYNVFVVIGARGANGRPLSACFRDNLSRFTSNNSGVLNYRGRWVVCPPLIDKSLRTQEACDIALRSLRELYGLPGRRAEFETYFQTFLRPNTIINIDGRVCRVTRSGGAVAEGTMQIAVRELA